MAKKITGWKTKGMNRDLSVSAFNPEFAFENINLRLSTNNNNTLMSWVNEKGPAKLPANCSTVLPIDSLEVVGIPIGTAIINHQLVLFTTINDKAKDRIYVFWYSNPQNTELEGKLLFEGNLNFSSDNPLETLVSYESENIQKIYWVDGRNQPRLINIKASDEEIIKWYSIAREGLPFTLFDFVNEMKLKEVVHVQKILGASGMFAPGVIQYAFTYYKKYGQETNIFYTTPLYYISPKERGASPEEKVDNAFRITLTYIDDDFDYVRVYSIQRTSIDATPIVKRVQDIDIKKVTKIPQANILQAVYTDIGTSGDMVDPMELLYKGGRTIIANTLEQKDNTLFLGNFFMEKPPYDAIKVAKETVSTEITLNSSTRSFKPVDVTSGSYLYQNQLSSYVNGTKSVPCGGFKYGDYYRLGIQFQYKTGEWSSVVYIPHYAANDTQRKNPLDFLITEKPSFKDNTISVPVIKGTLSNILANRMLQAGYKKIRPVVVFPGIQDRVAVCQGVGCPTLYTNNKRTDGGVSAQSSWFFRTAMNSSYPSSLSGSVAPYMGNYEGYLDYTRREIDSPSAYNPENIRRVEIQGDFDKDNQFRVDKKIITLHSPDVEFDTKLSVLDYSGFTVGLVGNAEIIKTVSDIDIQTETPTISNKGGGFVHKSFNEDGAYGIISGLFYDDLLVDDNGDEIKYYDPQHKTAKWMIYLWNRVGSLNNDFNRPADKGIQSAMLKKKIVSNLRYANTSWEEGNTINLISGSLQLFSSDNPTILKWKSDKDRMYQGNIDTLIMPDHSEGLYFCLAKTFDWDSLTKEEKIKRLMDKKNDVYWDLIDDSDKQAPFNSTSWWKTFNRSEDEAKEYGPRRWNKITHIWEYSNGDIGDDYALSLNTCKEGIRIKYKSTPHLVFEAQEAANLWVANATLPIMEVRKSSVNHATLFGGKSDDALKENVWIPCGEPVFLGNRNSHGQVEFEYSYGDTYYQRWDCLKTYAYTPEDPNQVIEIGSFMLETRVNIDGRYDRNRGQSSNLYISPQNFNLLNSVYSQTDNFFSYRIQDEEDFKNTRYPNQITWSKTKTSGADVDMYTNVTMASILEMDGDKGGVRKLVRYNDQLLSFQDKGIAQILYNENMQMSTTEGVPIEIANSGKVNGKRYISDKIGCSNKWSLTQTPSGIYFMDSINKGIFVFNGQLNNLSGSLGFNTWSKKNIPSSEIGWTPLFPTSESKSAFTVFYDKLNQDVLFVNGDASLAFSEKLAAFTSFYNYGSTPFFCNLDDTGIWIRTDSTIWKHQAGDYCNFFGVNHPFSMILVGNPEPQVDKIFTNLEFRATVDGDGTEEGLSFTPSLPFDSLEVWNEYQHGIANLENMRGHSAMLHHTKDDSASLKRKFRIWRCDIPRDNFMAPENNTEQNIYRAKRHPNDRMRNPWLYLKLMKDAAPAGEVLERTEIHDLLMTYFN